MYHGDINSRPTVITHRLPLLVIFTFDGYIFTKVDQKCKTIEVNGPKSKG